MDNIMCIYIYITEKKLELVHFNPCKPDFELYLVKFELG